MKKLCIVALIIIILVTTTLMLNAEGNGLFADPDPVETETPKDSIITNQSPLYSDDYISGINDARKAVVGNKAFFFSGCLLDVIGVFIPYILSYPPDPSMMKSSNPSYIMAFNQEYDKSMKNANFKYALYGILTKYAATVLFYILLWVPLFF